MREAFAARVRAGDELVVVGRARDVERFVVPSAKEHGVGFVSYSTLARKWLTGLLDYDELVDGDVRLKISRYTPTNLAYNQPILDEFLRIAGEAGVPFFSISGSDFVEKLGQYNCLPKQAGDVLWNFEKFLVGRDGTVLQRFSPDTAPDEPSGRSPASGLTPRMAYCRYSGGQMTSRYPLARA